MVFLVERHRKVVLGSAEGPHRDDLALVSADHRYLIASCRYVNEYPVPICFQLERFRMSRKFDALKYLPCRSVKDAQRCIAVTAIADENPIGMKVIAGIVR